jgi:hypothetical protein
LAYPRAVTTSRALAVVRPHWGRLRFTALAALGVLVAHDATFAAQYGLGSGLDPAMAMSGHAYWPAFVLLTLLVAGTGAAIAVRALVGLGRLLRGLPPTTAVPGQPAYLAEVRHLWPRLFGVVVVAFLLQENVEHVAAGDGLPGLWVLSAPEYPLAIPVLLLVTGLLAAAGGWLQWRREVLIGRLTAARVAALRHRHHAARAPHRRWALLAALLVHRWTLLRRDAERAPPPACAA